MFQKIKWAQYININTDYIFGVNSVPLIKFDEEYCIMWSFWGFFYYFFVGLSPIIKM